MGGCLSLGAKACGERSGVGGRNALFCVAGGSGNGPGGQPPCSNPLPPYFTPPPPPSRPFSPLLQASGPKRVVSAVVSVGGMLFFALLVGLATDLVASKVDQLEQGNGAVIESNHTLVCGWTPKTIPLVKALVEAGERPSVVVLAERESVDMDGDLLEAVPVEERGGMRVMTRRGDPLKAADLNRCSASQAASIVILSPQLPSRQQADAQ
ncbi:unnamed protein product, partial [Closterium sp. Naga37s-1]